MQMLTGALLAEKSWPKTWKCWTCGNSVTRMTQSASGTEMRRKYPAANLLVYYNTGRGWKLQRLQINADERMTLESERHCTIFRNGPIACGRAVRWPNMCSLELAASLLPPSRAGIHP